MAGISPDEAVIDGMANFVELSRDNSDVELGASIYRRVAVGVQPLIPVGEACKLAFPSMVIRPDIRTECLVAIFESKLIVAWQKGMLRKTTETLNIPIADISSAEAAVSTSSSTRGALLMTVQGSTSVTFALTTGRTDLADAVRAALTTGR